MYVDEILTMENNVIQLTEQIKAFEKKLRHGEANNPDFSDYLGTLNVNTAHLLSIAADMFNTINRVRGVIK